MPDIRSKGKTALVAQMLIYLLMAIFTVMAVYPILWLIIQSFKTTQDYLRSSKLALPARWFFRNFPDSWTRGEFGILIINSFIYTIVSVTSVIVLGFMAGFAFSKIPSKATGFIHGSFIIGILFTLQSIMVPLFLMINAVGLYNTRIGVLIPYIGIGLPICVDLSTEYIRSIPNALIESARIDGAKYLKILFCRKLGRKRHNHSRILG
jgi:raffinose/stachyose/melibiose transport system permease protein